MLSFISDLQFVKYQFLIVRFKHCLLILDIYVRSLPFFREILLRKWSMFPRTALYVCVTDVIHLYDLLEYVYTYICIYVYMYLDCRGKRQLSLLDADCKKSLLTWSAWAACEKEIGKIILWLRPEKKSLFWDNYSWNKFYPIKPWWEKDKTLFAGATLFLIFILSWVAPPPTPTPFRQS